MLCGFALRSWSFLLDARNTERRGELALFVGSRFKLQQKWPHPTSLIQPLSSVYASWKLDTGPKINDFGTEEIYAYIPGRGRVLLCSTVYSTNIFLGCPKYSQMSMAPSSDAVALSGPNTGPGGRAKHTGHKTPTALSPVYSVYCMDYTNQLLHADGWTSDLLNLWFTFGSLAAPMFL